MSSLTGNTRIHLNTERWRVCEAYFSPAMAGVDSAGLGEIIQNLIPSFIESRSRPGVLDFLDDRREVIQVGTQISFDLPYEVDLQSQNVFLTGQPSVLPGFSERLHAVLQSLLPPGSSINIRRAADPGLDSWKGMAAFSRTEEFRRGQCAVTKAEYEEYGGERVKRWWGGNWNGEFDIGVPVDVGIDNDDTKMDVDS